MHRFYLAPEYTVGDGFVLEAREAHHALDVLRLQPGETVIVLNGVGDEFQCSVADIGRHVVHLVVHHKKTLNPFPWQMTLLQAVPKGKTMETIIQKATELGVSRIVPLFSERCEVHLEKEGAQFKQQKWQSIAIEAIKQCGSAWLPRIDVPVVLATVFKRDEHFDLSLVAALQVPAQHPRTYLSKVHTNQSSTTFSLGIWIGPEGDFSPDEMQRIIMAGSQPVSLGPLILRSDTAAIYALSILSYECQWHFAPAHALG